MKRVLPTFWLVTSVAWGGLGGCGGGDEAGASDAAETRGLGGAVAADGSDDPALPPAAVCPTETGACSPTVLDSGLPSPGSFHLQDGALYWRNATATLGGVNRDPNSILRVRLPAGAPEVVADVGDGQLNTIDVDESFVYFGDSLLGVGRVPLAGGAIEVLTDAPSYVVLVDDTFVYFSGAAGSTLGIARVPKAGGAVESIAAAEASVLIAMDDAYVYWSTPVNVTNVLSRVPKAGGVVETLSNAIPYRPDRMVLVDGFLYILANVPLPTNGPRGLVLRLPAAGGPTEELLSTPLPISSLAVDQDRFYYGTCPGVAGEATVQRMDHAATTSVAIAGGGVCYAGVTVDATRVYFADWGTEEYARTGDGVVLVADKCGCR